MPELPEVQTIVSELNRKLKNKTIQAVEVRVPKMVSLGPATVANRRRVETSQVLKFIKLLKGQRILSVRRRAKLLIFNLSLPSPHDPFGVTQGHPDLSAMSSGPNGRSRSGEGRGRGGVGPFSMLVHLKLTGQFIYEDKKLKAKTGGYYRIMNTPKAPKVLLPCKHTHVIFTFTDGSHLYFNDIRKFGYLKLVRDNEINQIKDLQEFGPEPLDKKFTSETFLTAVKSVSKRRIKEVLMDPKIMAGIGNIYSDEILFHARVRPTRKVLSIKYQVLRNIYKYIKIVLRQAIKAKGSSVGDFIRTDGSWGSMGKFHFVYGRGGKKCKVCDRIIQTVTIGGRTSSYCPRCQN